MPVKVCTIRLDNDEDVGEVCAILNTYWFDVDAVYGRYVVDAKSLLGLMSLMNHDIDIYVHTEIYNIPEDVREDLEGWIVG